MMWAASCNPLKALRANPEAFQRKRDSASGPGHGHPA